MLPVSKDCQGCGGPCREPCGGIDSTADSCGAQGLSALEKLRCDGSGRRRDRPPCGRCGPRGCARRPGPDHRMTHHHAGEQGRSRNAPDRAAPVRRASAEAAAPRPARARRLHRMTPSPPNSTSRIIPSKRLCGIDSLHAVRSYLRRGTCDDSRQLDAVPRDSWHSGILRRPEPARAQRRPAACTAGQEGARPAPSLTTPPKEVAWCTMGVTDAKKRTLRRKPENFPSSRTQPGLGGTARHDGCGRDQVGSPAADAGWRVTSIAATSPATVTFRRDRRREQQPHRLRRRPRAPAKSHGRQPCRRPYPASPTPWA